MLLALKLVLTPSVIVTASLAGRRWGAAVSGWIVALPLTSGPIAFFFALQHGDRFAAHAAVGSLSGAIAEVAFCLAYAAAARRAGWAAAVIWSSLAFAAAAVVVQAMPLDESLPILLGLLATSVLALAGGLRFLPDAVLDPDRIARLAPPWDMPSRAIVSTVVLLLLTGFAETIGARLSGLLAVYPLYTAILAAFAQRLDGPAAAVQVLRGLLLGLFSFVGFFVVLALLLERVGIAGAFACALVVTIAAQALSLRRLRIAPR